MAPTNPTTEHNPETTQLHVGEQVLNVLIRYIRDVQDRNSLSLVSRRFCHLDGITRKRLTVHIRYYPNPTSLSHRFPFIQSLTLRGPRSTYDNGDVNDLKITPWIPPLAIHFLSLKELHIRCLVVHDDDLETLTRTRGNDLTSLKIKKCTGFSTDGLRHVSKYCNQLTTLVLDFTHLVEVKDGDWLRQLASNNTVLERLHLTEFSDFDAEYFALLAKNCSKSLISLKIAKCRLSELGDAFKSAVTLERFGGGYIHDNESELVGFEFPPNIRYLGSMRLHPTRYSSVPHFLNHITKLKLDFKDMDQDRQCLWFEGCPNLQVLYTDCGETGLQAIAKFCKKLRKLTCYRLVTDVGMIALAKGCNNLECLKIQLSDISNEALECLGTHVKNLCQFRLICQKPTTIDIPVDSGVRAMLMACRKLERLNITLGHGRLTDVGLEYIAQYGVKLRTLSLLDVSGAGLVKLSAGCPSLRKLKLGGSPFSAQDVASCVFNIPSLRYVWFNSSDRDHILLPLTRQT